MATRLYPIPDDAVALCDVAVDPVRLNREPRRNAHRAGIALRWQRLHQRRCRRLVRLAMGCSKRVRRGRPAWHARRGYAAGAASCAATTCRYHLADFYRREPLGAACAIVVANRGGLPQALIGHLLKMDRALVQYYEHSALARPALRRLLGDGTPKRDAAAASLDERVRAALAKGEATSGEVAALAHADVQAVRKCLREIAARGVVTKRAYGNGGRVGSTWWRLVDAAG